MKEREVTLSEVLEARERRAARQRALLEAYQMPLVSFTMNIAGPVKTGTLIHLGFHSGKSLLFAQFARVKAEVICREEVDAPTGYEAFYVVNTDAETLKSLAEETENYSELGRLFDMDVLSPDGVKLERKIPRRCLICGGEAKACASRRVHSVAELQAKTHEILQRAFDKRYSGTDERDIETIGNLACRALLYEVCVTPKPGLVDRDNNGSHRDMDIYTFMRSASALRPYFEKCAKFGRQLNEFPAWELFEKLRFIGKMAESAMLSATGGVNTHKGAIFSMGLVCGAAGRLDRELWRNPEAVLSTAADIVKGLSERDFSGQADTAGKRLFAQYGIKGVRGEAEAGFPTVLQYGLPVLEAGLSAGHSPDIAGAAALLSILIHTHDTNMLARSDPETESAVRALVRDVLDAVPYPDASILRKLDGIFTGHNLSPGGSADLLSLCWLLWFLKEEA